MISQLNASEIEEVLNHQLIGRLGCYSDGLLYVVPISYAYNNSCVYAHTQDGLKVDIMRKNPSVCFEIDTMHNMADWKSVIAWGEYEELIDEDERKMGLQILMDRTLPVITSETVELSRHWPFPPTDLNEIKGIVFRIRLTHKSGRYEKKEPALYFAS